MSCGISHHINIKADDMFQCNAEPPKYKGTYSAYYRRKGRLFLKGEKGNKIEIEDFMQGTRISDIHFIIMGK